MEGVGLKDVADSFGRYAKYYDLLYESKDYGRECDYIAQTVRRFSRIPISSLLDVGCGTGGHLLPLAAQGWQVHGIDLSESMLATAGEKARQAGVNVTLRQADARSFDLGQRFDAVICMFAVLGYITENAGLAAALDRIRTHLKPGGVFIMDFWYGPAVLTIRPSTRLLRRDAEGITVMRLAVPELDALHHVSAIRYELWAIRDSTVLDHVQEEHRVRFFFPEEIRHYLDDAGMDLLAISPFEGFPDREITERDWNAIAVARAREVG